MRKYIVASHGNLASGLLSAAQMIIGDLQGISCFDLYDYHSPLEIYEEIDSIVRSNIQNEILILTDLLGGSINNQLLSLCEFGNVQIISGVNLGILLEVYLASDSESVKELAHRAIDMGKKNIQLFNSKIIKDAIIMDGEKEEVLW